MDDKFPTTIFMYYKPLDSLPGTWISKILMEEDVDEFKLINDDTPVAVYRLAGMVVAKPKIQDAA